MEVVPSTSTPKRARSPRAKQPAAPAATVTVTTRKPATRKAKPTAPATPSPEELSGMIATAAYYIAEQRNFAPGNELDDWLVAEQQVRAQHG